MPRSKPGAREQGYPPLLAGFGASLVERALIDAFCRARGTPFATAVRENSLGIRLDTLHPELAGAQPADLLPPQPLQALTLRHTIGLSDPLTDDEIAHDAVRADDGLPQSLVACVHAYGLTHFKIKLRGEIAVDVARLRQIAAVLDIEAPSYRFTLDGNEQFHDVAAFRELWQALQQRSRACAAHAPAAVCRAAAASRCGAERGDGTRAAGLAGSAANDHR